jgi:hypothetical protein
MKLTIRDALEAGPVNVRFTKADGTRRDMRATTRKDLINYTFRTPEGENTQAPAGVIRVWDMEKSEWRSIREDRVLSWG